MNSEFENYRTFEDLLGGLNKVLLDKSIFKWAIPEDFNNFLVRLHELGGATDQLRVVATIGRIESAIKKEVFDSKKIAALLQDSPCLSKLHEGDDRYYVGLLIKRLSFGWRFDWAVKAIWEETSAEKVRVVLMDIAMQEAEDFSSILLHIAKAGQSYVKQNDLSESQICSRFLRVIKALRTVLQGWEEVKGERFGEAIDAFTSAPFAHLNSGQTKNNVRKNLVPEAIGLLLDLIGQRFSLAIEYEHYIVLKRIRRWCDDKSWKELHSKHRAMRKLSNTIAESVLILARQSVADGELLKRLAESSKNEHEFNERCKSLAGIPNLDEELAQWLSSGGRHREEKKIISSERLVSSRGEDADVGELVLRISETKNKVRKVASALGDLELFDPSLVSVLKDLVLQWEIVEDVANKISSRKSISLVGSPGEKMNIDRKLFEVSDEGDVYKRYGLVVRPAIVKREEGHTKTIKKGVVKSTEK